MNNDDNKGTCSDYDRDAILDKNWKFHSRKETGRSYERNRKIETYKNIWKTENTKKNCEKKVRHFSVKGNLQIIHTCAQMCKTLRNINAYI